MPEIVATPAVAPTPSVAAAPAPEAVPAPAPISPAPAAPIGAALTGQTVGTFQFNKILGMDLQRSPIVLGAQIGADTAAQGFDNISDAVIAGANYLHSTQVDPYADRGHFANHSFLVAPHGLAIQRVGDRFVPFNTVDPDVLLDGDKAYYTGGSVVPTDPNFLLFVNGLGDRMNF